ncbi:MAG TPA: hypothetical protein VML96_13420 [Egibacteraceae bacterium]|nr:hypothetical protein [Egibacteraceae bacterium]
MAAALDHYRHAIALGDRLAAVSPDDPQAPRDLSVSQDRIGDVLGAQGDGPGALAAYRQGLGIAEALAARDPANTQWQMDVVGSCARLGTLASAQTVQLRRHYLLRGRAILAELKGRDRLQPGQDWIEWFDAQLAQLPTD